MNCLVFAFECLCVCLPVCMSPCLAANWSPLFDPIFVSLFASLSVYLPFSLSLIRLYPLTQCACTHSPFWLALFPFRAPPFSQRVEQLRRMDRMIDQPMKNNCEFYVDSLLVYAMFQAHKAKKKSALHNAVALVYWISISRLEEGKGKEGGGGFGKVLWLILNSI